MNTFIELLNKPLAKSFEAFSNKPEVSALVAEIVPMSISLYLRNELEKTKTEATITFGDKRIGGDLIKFRLKPNKKGASVAFLPEAEFADNFIDLVSSESLELDEQFIENFSYGIIENEEFVDIFKNHMSGMRYEDGEWVTSKKNDESMYGVRFEDTNDIGFIVATYFKVILECLNSTKDPSSEVELPIIDFGTFKIKGVKNGYSVTMTFDKEFKSNCKNDKLAEELS